MRCYIVEFTSEIDVWTEIVWAYNASGAVSCRKFSGGVTAKIICNESGYDSEAAAKAAW